MRHRGVTGAWHRAAALCDAGNRPPCNTLRQTRIRLHPPKKIAFCSVMTTDSSSVRVPPRKGEQPVGRTAALNLRSKSWEGETQAARSPAAAPGENKKSAGLGWYVKSSEQGIVPAHFFNLSAQATICGYPKTIDLIAGSEMIRLSQRVPRCRNLENSPLPT